MTEPSLQRVLCPDAFEGHHMAWWQWGQADSPHLVVCAHGLTRQGRDFDVLAREIVLRSAAKGKTVRVVCPDVVGRGKSDWLKDPMAYGVPTYAADMLAMLSKLHQTAPIQTLDWVGTSMGGLIGMVMAGQPDLPLPVAICRLVLNDVGPSIQWQALQRIGTYVGNTGQFASVQQAADAMWAVSRSFGPHTPEQWLALSEPMVRPIDVNDPAAGLKLHYDPALAVPFRGLTEEAAKAGEAALWAVYDNIKAQTLLVRGAVSDLLTPATAHAMTQRGPQARLVEIEGVGHAPTLISPDQIQTVADWLLA